MKKAIYLAILALLAASMACNLLTPSTPPTTEPGPPTEPSAPTLPPVPAATEAPSAPATAAPAVPAPGPQESILILEPGPGSRILSPLHVAGISDPAFEQTIVVRIILIDGSQLALEPTFIQSDLGERGPFSVDISFSISSEQPGFIQAYIDSPRDGGITHLASVGVTLAASGAANILPGAAHPELIDILQPASGATISGGSVHVEGFGLAGFEQTLLIEVYDEGGTLVGSQPVMVNAPDLGFPGPFSADVAYAIAAPGAGRIVVRDQSPAFGGDTHVSSVEINLQP